MRRKHQSHSSYLQRVMRCHTKHVNYVTYIAKFLLELSPLIPSPCKKPVLDEFIINLVSCNCRKSKCSTNQCVCKNHGLNCTDLCNCNECENNDEAQCYVMNFYPGGYPVLSVNCYQRGSSVRRPSAFNSPIWTRESLTQHPSTRQSPS